MPAIYLNEIKIQPGDHVTITDRAGNCATGQVHVVGGRYTIGAFGTEVVFARTNRNGRTVPVKGVTVTAHAPQLELYRY